MKKKILVFILSIALVLPIFTGCALITKDEEREAMSVIAEVKPREFSYRDSNNVVQTLTFPKETKKIYRIDLINALNSNLNSWMQENQGATLEQGVEYFVDSLVSKELMLAEAEFLVERGEINLRMGGEGKAYNDINNINRYLYQVVDQQLFNLVNEIRAEHDQDPIPQISGAPDPDAKYPVEPDYNAPDEDEEEPDDFVEWRPSPARAPQPTEYARIEALKRFYSNIAKNAIESIKATEQEKKEFEQERDMYDEWAQTGATIYKVYEHLSQSKILDYLLTKSTRESLLLTKLQEYIAKDIVILDSDINQEYTTIYDKQVNDFKDRSNYVSAVTGGTETILFYPTSDYFYVRHILLGFDDAQQAAWNAYKADPNRSTAQKELFRQQLATQIKVYQRVNGNDDLARPALTAQQAYNEIYAKMQPLAGNAMLAERQFVSLIYQYNTDPGMFDSKKGYAIGPKPDKSKGETEQMVAEFADAARELRAQYNIDGRLGTISGMILSDYGYHILYLSEVPRTNEQRELSDFISPNARQTYYDVIKETIKTQKEESAYEFWRQENIQYYLRREDNNHVTFNVNKYSNIYS